MKKVLVNILCWFIPFKSLRKRVRLSFSVPVRQYVNFAKSFSSSKHPRIKLVYGYRCVNLVVIVDDKFVFKFPRDNDGWDIATREKRITDALRSVSPIKIPEMEIIDFNGIAVRKYECIKGIGFHSLDDATQNAHADKIAKQLAMFLYKVGIADPASIRDLKPSKVARPSIMCGWNQNDLWDNFILNPKTYDVVAVIDWEGAAFIEFDRFFTGGTHNSKIRRALLREYLKLYIKK